MHQKHPPENTAEADPGGANIVAGLSASSSAARVQETKSKPKTAKEQRIRYIMDGQSYRVRRRTGAIIPIDPVKSSLDRLNFPCFGRIPPSHNWLFAVFSGWFSRRGAEISGNSEEAIFFSRFSRRVIVRSRPRRQCPASGGLSPDSPPLSALAENSSRSRP